MPRRNQPGGFHCRHRPRFQKAIQRPFGKCSLLLRRVRGQKIHAFLRKLPLEGRRQRGAVRPRLIHFIDEDENRNFVFFQQPPQSAGMPLRAVRAADDQNRRVQHLKRALHLTGKIHMPRGIQQRDGRALPGQLRLLGEDGDAPLPLLGIGIQKGVPVIHPPQPPQPSGAKEHGLR